MIRAVAFDLDDTLYDCEGIHKGSMEDVAVLCCKRLGINRATFFEAYGMAREEIKDALGRTASCHNRMLYFQRMLEILGEQPAGLALEMHDVYWDTMLRRMAPREGAVELLRICGERGIKTAICTDQIAQIQHRKIRVLELENLVNVLVTSEEAGAEKPSPVIFQLLLEKLAAEPNEVLFIGDSLEKDVEGPREMGMYAFWFHDERIGQPYRVMPIERILRILGGGDS